MQLQIELYGDKQMNHELLRMGLAVANLEPAWLAIMHNLEQVEKKQFDSEGGYASGGWEALSEGWLKFKRENGYDRRILRMTGRLFDSMTEWDSPWAIRRLLPKGFEFGTSAPYAGAHQNPGEGSRIPQRRFLELTLERREAYVRTLLTYARTGIPTVRPIP